MQPNISQKFISVLSLLFFLLAGLSWVLTPSTGESRHSNLPLAETSAQSPALSDGGGNDHSVDLQTYRVVKSRPRLKRPVSSSSVLGRPAPVNLHTFIALPFHAHHGTSITGLSSPTLRFLRTVVLLT